jgi:nucleoside-diphosphate-sugar epimerase
MAPRIVLTGASGYIGSRLVDRAVRRGCEIVVLGSAPPFVRLTAIRWRLGEAVPLGVLDGASAVIHLGHSWASDASAGTSAGNLNLRGGLALAQAALAANVAHFVFASTTSARPQALNAYGRIKHAIEQHLLALPGERVLCARIGLVYGGPDRGQYGMISKLVEMTPVLPMIGIDRELQPIHLDEVCDGLLKLALDPPRDRRTFILAGSPFKFGAWLRALRRARRGRGLRLIPLPTTLALLACDATTLVPFAPTVSRERVLGLAGAAPMESAADLASLGMRLDDPYSALMRTRAARRRLIGEAAAMLTYVGEGQRRRGMIMRLARVLARDPARCRGLPRIAVKSPPLLRLFEPLKPSMQHALSRRLHLAAMVAEADGPPPHGAARPFLSMLVQVALEILAAPLRLVLARITR